MIQALTDPDLNLIATLRSMGLISRVHRLLPGYSKRLAEKRAEAERIETEARKAKVLEQRKKKEEARKKAKEASNEDAGGGGRKRSVVGVGGVPASAAWARVLRRRGCRGRWWPSPQSRSQPWSWLGFQVPTTERLRQRAAPYGDATEGPDVAAHGRLDRRSSVIVHGRRSARE